MASNLVEARAKFSLMLARLVIWAHETYPAWQVSIGEVERPSLLAKLYAKMGIGIGKSLHIDGLAADLRLYKHGAYQTDSYAYKPLGAYWETLGGAWGGRFRKPDGNHFSLPWGGRK